VSLGRTPKVNAGCGNVRAGWDACAPEMIGLSLARFEGPAEAWSILRAGPEPLVSHFNVSYGLVLNLLSIYSLEQVWPPATDCSGCLLVM
jgi:hypothetical protein